MSKQRNKRNTRRGRAKRWRFQALDRVGVWTHRCHAVCYNEPAFGDVWVVSFRPMLPKGLRLPSRAAAMRAAEHLASGR